MPKFFLAHHVFIFQLSVFTTMAPKKGKKANAHQWPVAFSPLRRKVAKKKKESLDFSGSSSSDDDDDDAGSSNLLKLPALETGTVLEACNGSDIQLARGASARPNLAKGRGRYLIILPGIMSFKSRSKQIKPIPENDSKAEAAVGKAKQNDEDDEEETKSVEDNGDKKPAARNPFQPRVTMLGKIQEIESEAPIMKVPFDDGRSLVFQGKKVDTSSKYMILNCKASKGSVTCKVSLKVGIAASFTLMWTTNSLFLSFQGYVFIRNHFWRSEMGR
jgi:hypothetical protein